MRIEVIETLSAYEKKRWEFVCILDSRGLHIRLSGMTLEQRDGMDKRIPFKPVLIWADTPAAMERVPHTRRMQATPKVPLSVQRTMRKHLEATIHYNFDVCIPKTEPQESTAHH